MEGRRKKGGETRERREMERIGTKVGEEGEGEREVELGEKERRWKGLGRKGREEDEWEEES